MRVGSNTIGTIGIFNIKLDLRKSKNNDSKSGLSHDHYLSPIFKKIMQNENSLYRLKVLELL